MNFLTDLPVVPMNQRPKPLYVNITISQEEDAHLISLGWSPIDVRLLPSQTDGDRANAIKAYLEGLRMGSIEGANKTLLDFLELEGKTCGLIGNKIPQNEQVKKAESTEELLNFGSRRAFAGQQDPLENLTMNREGPKKKRVAKKTPV